MPNVFDQFDEQTAGPGSNVFDQFDDVTSRTAVATDATTDPGEDFARAVFPGTFEFNRGVQLGFGNALSGLRQLINLDDPEAVLAETEDITRRDKEIERLGGFATAGSIAGEVAPSMAVPGGVAGGLARRLATNTAINAATTVADPVREGQTRGGNVRTAAAFSVGGGVVGEGIRRVAGRISNALAGNVSNKQIREIIDTADANEIRVFFDDLSDSALAKRASVAAEVFGALGTGRGRALQNEEAARAANRWLRRVSADSDDFEDVIQEGLKRKLAIFKREASRKYGRVAREIGEDAGAVGTPKFDRFANAGIDAETAKGTRANAQVVDFLQRFRDAPRGDFDAMIEFRSDLNKELQGFLVNSDGLSKSSIDALMRAKQALDDDMSAFARSRGAQSAWRAANEFYRNTVAQFKIGKLKALTNERSAANFDATSAWRYLVANTTNPVRARRMFQALDAKGRAAVRAGLLKEAVNRASPEGQPFSPARFAGYLERVKPVTDQFFRGRSGEEIGGLVKLMRHIERAGQFAENPPTGQRLIPFLFVGGAGIEPVTTTAVAGGALGIQGLFQNPTGRNLLLASSKAAPGSEEMNRIVERLESFVARSSNQP